MLTYINHHGLYGVIFLSKKSDEQTKLLATFLNNVGVVCISVGFIAPLATGIDNSGILFWIFAGIMLHFAGYRVLDSLDEDEN